MACENCSYDKNGNFEKLCGPCEENAIKERIEWWQEGKRKLKKMKKSENNCLHLPQNMI